MDKNKENHRYIRNIRIFSLLAAVCWSFIWMLVSYFIWELILFLIANGILLLIFYRKLIHDVQKKNIDNLDSLKKNRIVIYQRFEYALILFISLLAFTIFLIISSYLNYFQFVNMAWYEWFLFSYLSIMGIGFYFKLKECIISLVIQKFSG